MTQPITILPDEPSREDLISIIREAYEDRLVGVAVGLSAWQSACRGCYIMAGSWNHMTNTDGTPYGNFGVGTTMDNLGDLQEALEKCYGMIWYMAERLAEEISIGRPSRPEILEIITEADDHRNEGLARGRSGQ